MLIPYLGNVKIIGLYMGKMLFSGRDMHENYKIKP
jgi:hypothetical protein